MKKLSVLSVVAALATLIATTIATSACVLLSYQPEEPACLKDE